MREYNILDTEKNIFIPIDENNRHYKAYLRWLAEGNEPDPIETEEEIADRLKREEELAIQKKIEDRMKELALADLKSKGEVAEEYVLKGSNK